MCTYFSRISALSQDFDAVLWDKQQVMNRKLFGSSRGRRSWRNLITTSRSDNSMSWIVEKFRCIQKVGLIKSGLAVVLISISLSSCRLSNSRTDAVTPSHPPSSVSLTNDEKHQFYSAALAATESPLESEIFRTVCQKIEIFGAGGSPNDNYLPFVSAHVDWALRAETQQFKLEINTREKAGSYVAQHMPR